VQSVFLDQGKPVCFVAEGSGYELRSVEVGQNNGKWVEVVSGLSDGETVLLSQPAGATLRPAVAEVVPVDAEMPFEAGGAPAAGGMGARMQEWQSGGMQREGMQGRMRGAGMQGRGMPGQGMQGRGAPREGVQGQGMPERARQRPGGEGSGASGEGQQGAAAPAGQAPREEGASGSKEPPPSE
jgi:hypothetical protein